EGTRVVFLSACSSGRGNEASGEGLGAFARALLEAGASAVVGTLWPVDDRASAELATAFHRHLAAGASPASALQLAKLERLHAGHPPASWAAFELIGATAPGKENKP
ncbi:MAG TPA: CHAT domain-containing protein, partial [Thermoanaerobaculia bacterium]|nr:CHAT domain-containing protein [Thermoanaerobaculia bacterium]